MINIALVGYGYWGPNLARCISASGTARLAVVCESAPERAGAARAALHGVPVVSDPAMVFTDPAINAVVLATPAPTHGCLALEALRHGKHVLVEKPFTTCSREALAMAEASERQGLVLMVDHTYLYHPGLVTIRQVIASRRLGAIRYYHSVRANCFGPSHETSVLWDLAVHDLAILDVLMPAAPATVRATGLRVRPGAPHSHAQLTLRYPDDALASLVVSWVAPAKVRTIVMGFDRHTIVWDDLVAGSSVRLFNRGVQPIPDPADRRLPQTVVEPIPVPSSEPLANAIGHFLDCVTAGLTPTTGAASGIRTVQLVEVAERGMAEEAVPGPVEAVGATA